MEYHRGVTVCAGLCPLCGQPNRCARVGASTDAGRCGNAALDCWCATETFTPELQQLIPETARGRACVCLSCVQAHTRMEGDTRPLRGVKP
jgi:Cysteine-rich CWC